MNRETSTMSINFPKEEEVTLERWRDINAFQRQVRAKHHLPCRLPVAIPCSLLHHAA